MQTFLPYDGFTESARVLDNKRLGKQRVETMQIMAALHTGKGWIHHPATKMWRGRECALLYYQEAICHEWTSRGYKDACRIKTYDLHMQYCDDDGNNPPPFWLGDPEFHRAHRSNLLRKFPEHYGPLFEPDLPDDLPYVWPV